MQYCRQEGEFRWISKGLYTKTMQGHTEKYLAVTAGIAESVLMVCSASGKVS